jgi:hypothetical protein
VPEESPLIAAFEIELPVVVVRCGFHAWILLDFAPRRV